MHCLQQAVSRHCEARSNPEEKVINKMIVKNEYTRVNEGKIITINYGLLRCSCLTARNDAVPFSFHVIANPEGENINRPTRT